MLSKATALLLVGASMSMWVGCSKTSSRYVYAAIPSSSAIVAYREDPNSGVLTALTGSPITAGSAVESLVIHPSGKFLYAANSGANNVSLFTISSAGALAEVTPRASTGTAPTLLAMDPAGAFLYVGNTGSFDISVFSVDATSGALTPVTQTGGATAGIGISPLSLKISPSGNMLYVTGQGSQGYVEAIPLSAGVLGQPVFGSPFLTGNNPYGLAIDPAGTHLYTANKLDNTISEFTVNADGSLTALGGSPIGETYSGPVSLLIDNSGKYLYVANQGSTNLAAYTIGSDGALTLLTNSPFTTGSGPSVVGSDPSGKYLFVGNQTSPAVQSFSLDASSGTLSSVATYSVSATPTSIVVTQ